ncbi:DUF6716 putative glycosyltransferase [Promicromonospora thailandica]|uniref:Uncharacterized protein n=1 Tax=Promicromonospora thailandica TaxID=765201 RepID=A0A9X2G680_9MICO|nr:DUF6716 putative glycosyltransferase [Promicromonospora thailandica]MCP2266112.1 hypothetical protein [Promicromonospora thailandica]BFF20581.1 hypothetical protein GCM10025730_41020 [Promicromonospora thailandica]
MTIRVLAVADSDSYLKWACATLDRIGAPEDEGLARSAVLVRTPIIPTTNQIAAAVAGSSVVRPPVLSLRELKEHVRETRPDVVLVAATGPVAEMVARIVVRADPANRPALVTGLPGMALPATPRGTAWRRWCDAFIVHSRREIAAYRDAFAAQEAQPRIVLGHLPFLERLTAIPSRPTERVVFAAQAKVPEGRDDRVRLLDGLARLSTEGFEVIVKLRARKGERQTHNELHPYDELWDAEHERLGHRSDAVRFVDGPMAEWLQPGTALVTVSSTAALESLALHLPTALVDDFGVDATLLNEPFAGSGCMVSLADTGRAFRENGPVPDPEWLDENYLHATESELPGIVAELAALRASGDLTPLPDVEPWSARRHAKVVAQSILPASVYGAILATGRPVKRALDKVTGTPT